jgi:hypothetical protein
METLDKFEGRKRKAGNEISEDLANENKNKKNNKQNKKQKGENTGNSNEIQPEISVKTFDPKKDLRSEKFEFYYKVNISN